MSTKPTTAVAFRLLASREQLAGGTGDCLENVDVGSVDDGALEPQLLAKLFDEHP